MKFFSFRRQKRISIYLVCGLLAACSPDLTLRGDNEGRGQPLRFGAEISLGRTQVNPAAPFLRVAPDGRLFAMWTEDAANQEPKSSGHAAHHATGKMAPSPMRDLFLAASTDGGATWSSAKRVNRSGEAIQAEEIKCLSGRVNFFVINCPERKCTLLIA